MFLYHGTSGYMGTELCGLPCGGIGWRVRWPSTPGTGRCGCLADLAGRLAGVVGVHQLGRARWLRCWHLDSHMS